jgi:CRP/FNR family transcriptional regulator
LQILVCDCTAFLENRAGNRQRHQKWKLNLKSFAAQKIASRQNGNELGIKRTDSLSEQTVVEARSFTQRPPIHAMALPRKVHVDSTQGSSACVSCPLYELNLCTAARNKAQLVAELHPGASQLTSSTNTVPARRTICHPKEWSEFVLIICGGRAVSSVALPDGRRQILSLLLPGDIVFATGLFEPISGRAVEAITEVIYRKFKRSEFKALLFEYPDLFEMLAKIWSEERARADQLALDLGRRTADERIARLILNLAERLAERGMMNGQTMEFPLRQRHIADATGLTAVHVSKVLGEFQRAGLIAIGSRSLTITDATELRRVAGPK